MSQLLRLEAVTKEFPGTRALDGISLDVMRGEVIALLGPSGCGKSTLLRLIAELDTPTSGAISWPGLNAAKPAPGEIGFVFQEPTLMPWASVEANITLPLELIGRTPIAGDTTVSDLIKSVGLQGFEHALPRTLSGGMRMRVSLARALSTKPSILLLDEPFAALDEITRHALNDALLKLRAERELTIVFVTHSVFESVYLADRVTLFSPRPGRITQTFEIAAPPDRTQGFRFTSGYADQCREISASLSRAMGERRVA
ncbi:MAG TPA: ABC transporter ATP-binding protein [Alphaproteobacteria bacterium]|nr:ABC transporter ATP-binding protein [Alphaproteobacteria bacterium]